MCQSPADPRTGLRGAPAMPFAGGPGDQPAALMEAFGIIAEKLGE